MFVVDVALLPRTWPVVALGHPDGAGTMCLV